MNEVNKEDEYLSKELKEDEQTIRRILSRLSFIREDINAIGKLKIKTPSIKKIVDEITDKLESLLDIFFPGRVKD